MARQTTKTTAVKKDKTAELLKRIEELENAIKAGGAKEPEGKIQQDDYISVMSLLPYPLILSTQRNGQGNVKKFTKFGEVKRITYKDLVDILENNSNFLQAGYFYILHPALIRQHGLDDLYSRILTKEKIEKILNADDVTVLDVFQTANKEQQEIIIEMIIGKLTKELTSMNMNVVDAIARASGVKIMERVNNNREFEEQRKELAQAQ